MFSLVIIVVTIGLLAAVAAATVNYMPLDAQLRQQMFKDADRGVKAIECAVTRYLNDHRDGTGNIIYDGDGVNLVNTVMPKYGFLPAEVRKEMGWEITTGQVSGMPAVGICLRPTVASTPIQREVLGKLQAQLPVGSAYVASGCNATTNVANGAYLTYWVPLAHVN
jgi:hypothetical protein